MTSLQKGGTQSRKEQQVEGESFAPLRLCVRFSGVFGGLSY
jgi:hypothetical protein